MSFSSIQEDAVWQVRARTYNHTGFVLALLGLFWPSLSYDALITCLLVFPFVGLVIVWKSNGLVRVDHPHQQLAFRKSIAPGMLVPICTLGLRANLDFTYLAYFPLWTPAIISAGAFWLM